MKPAIARILSEGTSGAEALHLLLAMRRQDSGHSLNDIVRITGIPSRGYISDLVKGRRRLTPLHLDKILNYLNLSPFLRESLRLLIESDLCRDVRLRAKIRKQAKSLLKLGNATKLKAEPSGEPPSPFASILFTSFGLFSRNPTYTELCQLFLPRDETENATTRDVKLRITKALLELEQMQLVGYCDGAYQLLSPIVLLDDATKKAKHLNFLQQSAEEAKRQIPKWFDQRELSCFQSFYLTVKQEEYILAVREIKDFIYKKISALESSVGDSVAQFDIHIFPHVLPIEKITSAQA